MAVISVDGKTTSFDRRQDRIAAGTLGNEQVVPGTLTGRSINNTISLFDQRVSYGGDWSISLGALPEDYLAQAANSLSNSDDTISVVFNGTGLTIIGSNVPGGGEADVYVDDILTPGRVNTYTRLSLTQYVVSGLNETDTTIYVASTTDFPSSGTIQIDGEVIDYASKTGGGTPSFNGCTRSGVDRHNTDAQVYGYSSRVSFYAAYKQARVKVWSSTNLTPGTHTLTMISTGTKDASSVGYAMYINGFIVGGLVGASNLSTFLDTVNAGSRTFGADGMSTVAFTPQIAAVDKQILAIYGASGFNAGTYVPVFTSYDPTSGAMHFYAPTAASSTLNPVIVNVLVAGSTL